MPDAIGDSKRELRRRMRVIRSSLEHLADLEARTARLWDRVRAEPAVRDAHAVLAYESVPGEPASASFIEWCRANGKQVVVPAAERAAPFPLDPSGFDAALVPGLAFTRRGDRLGQGGGWYDRLLLQLRPDCTTIGVCFAVQVVDEIAAAPHDARVDVVVTEDDRFAAAGS